MHKRLAMCYPYHYPCWYCSCYPLYQQYTGFCYPSYYYATYPAYYYTPVYYGGAYLAPPRGEYKHGNCITIC
jgi:hypothetical protein